MEADSSVATPAKPIKLGQRRWVKRTIRSTGVLTFLGLLVVCLMKEDRDNVFSIWHALPILLASVLGFSSLMPSVDEGADYWEGSAPKSARRVAWLFLAFSTFLAFSHVVAWKADQSSRATVIVVNGRTNLEGGLFMNPFSRGKVVLKDFTATEDVAWNRGTTTKMSAKFRIIPDEKLVRAFAAKGGNAQAQLESSAKACLGYIFRDSLEWKRPIRDVAETGKLGYQPKTYERNCWSPTPLIYLVGPVTLSDSAGLPVEKVWFSD